MSVQAAITYSPRSLDALEEDISEKVAQKRAEVFGDRKVIAIEGTPLHEEIEAFIKQATSPFPAAPNGSRYIKSTCTVCPKLYVNFSRLEPLYSPPIEGNLLLQEIGKIIDVGVLQDPVLGGFTQEPTALVLRNICMTTMPLERNEHAIDQLAKDLSGLKVAAIGAHLTIGEVDRNPSLHKTKIQADVEFGTLIDKKKQLIEMETTGDETTTELVITLPGQTAKIQSDGSVSLPNGAKFTVDQFLDEELVTWVDQHYVIEVPFEI